MEATRNGGRAHISWRKIRNAEIVELLTCGASFRSPKRRLAARRTNAWPQVKSLIWFGTRVGQIRNPAKQNLRRSTSHEVVTGNSRKNQFDGMPWRYRCNVPIIPIDI